MVIVLLLNILFDEKAEGLHKTSNFEKAEGLHKISNLDFWPYFLITF